MVDKNMARLASVLEVVMGLQGGGGFRLFKSHFYCTISIVLCEFLLLLCLIFLYTGPRPLGNERAEHNVTIKAVKEDLIILTLILIMSCLLIFHLRLNVFSLGV